MEDNSNIKEYKFTLSASDKQIYVYITAFSESAFIWIGQDCRLSSLSLALPIKSESKSTQIFGESYEGSVRYMAERLSKRLNKQVLMSYNLPQENAFEVEKHLIEKIRNEQLFT